MSLVSLDLVVERAMTDRSSMLTRSLSAMRVSYSPTTGTSYPTHRVAASELGAPRFNMSCENPNANRNNPKLVFVWVMQVRIVRMGMRQECVAVRMRIGFHPTENRARVDGVHRDDANDCARMLCACVRDDVAR